MNELRTDMQRLQLGQWLLERQVVWIAQADVKVGLIATANVAGIASLASAVATHASNQVGFWTAAISFAGWVVSLAFCALAVIPRLDGPPSSVIFFGKVASADRARYQQTLRTISATELLSDVADQIHVNAEIAAEKHVNARRASCATGVALLFWLIANLAFYFEVAGHAPTR